MAEPYIVEIELRPDAQDDLRRIMDGLGLNESDLGEAIGAALGMEAFLLEEVAKGGKIIVVDKEGQQHQLRLKTSRESGDGERADRR